MTVSLAGKKIAILAANGFDENHVTAIQRALIKEKAVMKTVAPEQGVVNGWQGAGWGHYFPVDAQIGETLGSDFDYLVLPGGERGTTKLKTNLHTRRIISHFLEAGKPVAAIGAGVGLLALSTRIAGHSVVAPVACHDELKASGAVLVEGAMEPDGMILTADGTDVAAWVEAALALFGSVEWMEEAA